MRIWHNVSDKMLAALIPFMNVVNEHLSLQNYSRTVQHVVFLFLVQQSDFHRERFYYNKKRQEIYIEKNLPYEQVEQATEEEVLQLMAQLYLRLIDDYPKLRLPDFDHQKFKRNVQRLFEAQGWLVAEAAS